MATNDKPTRDAASAPKRFQISDLDFEAPPVPAMPPASVSPSGSPGYDAKETRVSPAPLAKSEGTQVFEAPTEELDKIGLLYCRKGLRKGQFSLLKQRRNEFGRALDCDVVVEDDHVSAHHGAFLFDNGNWNAFDFASANGTFVNGIRLGSQGPNPTALKDDDVINVGSSEFVFKQIQA